MGCNLGTEMGNDGQALSTSDPNYVYKKNFKLTKNEYLKICNETKQSKEMVDEIFELFFKNNTKGYLNKSDFVELYCSLK